MKIQRYRRAFIDEIFINRLAIYNAPRKTGNVSGVEILKSELRQDEAIERYGEKKEGFVVNQTRHCCQSIFGENTTLIAKPNSIHKKTRHEAGLLYIGVAV